MPIHLVPHDPRTFPTKSEPRRVRGSLMLSNERMFFSYSVSNGLELMFAAGNPDRTIRTIFSTLINFNRILTRRLSFFISVLEQDMEFSELKLIETDFKS